MAAKDIVKVIGLSVSPFVARPRIVLNLKGIEFEFLEEQFGKKSELLLKSNPVYKKVPVLIHEGKPICESLIIVQYIDEIWANSGFSILPSDPYDRAIARFWGGYIDDKILLQTRPFLEDSAESTKVEAKEQLLATMKQLEEAFEQCSKGKNFFGGDNIGYVDIALGSYLGWIKAFEKIAGAKFLDETKTPLLTRWAACFVSADSVKEVIPEADELVEFAKVLAAARRSSAPPS